MTAAQAHWWSNASLAGKNVATVYSSCTTQNTTWWGEAQEGGGGPALRDAPSLALYGPPCEPESVARVDHTPQPDPLEGTEGEGGDRTGRQLIIRDLKALTLDHTGNRVHDTRHGAHEPRKQGASWSTPDFDLRSAPGAGRTSKLRGDESKNYSRWPWRQRLQKNGMVPPPPPPPPCSAGRAPRWGEGEDAPSSSPSRGRGPPRAPGSGGGGTSA